ncbi:MAG TPA: prepilin-type N-terminal cleavage/methylation domain-containing protein [Bacteroidia bacterium]|nr:prepilin-type N-terminal cleavage/methylation domain-containing protein [Bacteroidia bacterium]
MQQSLQGGTDKRMEQKNKEIIIIKKGFSLIEILIAISLFAIVAIISTQSLTSTLRSSRKSEAISRSREDVDHAMSTMERLLRNALEIDQSLCTGTNLTYTDEYGNQTTLTCNGGANGYIASGSARLTSQSVYVDCTLGVFNCPVSAVGVPEGVEISMTVRDANQTGAEGSMVTQQSKILLRNYNNF